MVSYVFYSLLAIFCGICGYRAERTEKKRYLWTIIIVLSVVSGLRAASVGLDTNSYLEKFKTIQEGRLDLAFGLEEGFKYIVCLIQWIIPSGQAVLLLMSFVTNWCIIKRFWELRKGSCFWCMVLCYYMSFYFMTMNTARQFLAVAIVFYCVRYLDQKRVGRFIAGVLFATLFHKSAVVSFLYLAIFCLRWKEFSLRQKRVIQLCVAAVFAGGLVLLLIGFFSRYTKYITALQIDIGYMLPLKLALVLLTTGRFLKLRNAHADPNERFMLLAAESGYIMALLIGILGYFWDGIERVGLYFFLYEGVYIGTLLKEKEPRRRAAYAVVAGTLVLYSFAYSMINNSQGQMPYRLSNRVIDVNNGISVCGYAFDETGKPVKLANGVVEENGTYYYYENGQRVYKGITIVDGEYRYFTFDGQMVRDCSYWVSKTNDYLDKGRYTFAEDGSIPSLEECREESSFWDAIRKN